MFYPVFDDRHGDLSRDKISNGNGKFILFLRIDTKMVVIIPVEVGN